MHFYSDHVSLVMGAVVASPNVTLVTDQ